MIIDKDQGNEMQTYSSPRCYSCNSQGDLLYKDLKDRLYDTPGVWNIRKCSNPKCGLVWLDPMPLEKEIGKAYKTYFTHANIRSSKKDPKAEAFLLTLLRRTFYVLTGAISLRNMRSKLLKMYLPDITKGRLLEVGCGDGFRLATMRRFGWHVEGQEVDPKAAKNAYNTHGICIRLGKLTDIALTSNSYDAIIMVHVIEHVHNPILLFNECYRILKPGGTLVCITPNIESYGHKYFRSSWLHLDPPRHLFLFSPKSMKNYLEKSMFKQYKIITTPANAEKTYSGSRNIQLKGKHRINEQLRLNTVVQEMIFQRRALAIYQQDCLSGEEIVNTLIK